MFGKKSIATYALAAVLASVGMTQTAAAEDVLKIGGIGTLSGGGTAWGLAIQRGALLAIDEVNAAGGLKVGDKTYKVELVMYDDKYTGKGGTTAATRLVNEDKVKYIIGPIGSGPVLATVSVTTPQKVLVMSNGYNARILKNDAKAPYNFRVTNTTTEYIPEAVDWVKKNYPGKNKVGMLSPNDASGQWMQPIMIKYYEEAGFDVAYKDYYERGTKEFTPLLTRALAAGIDIFELDGNAPGDAAVMLKQIKQLGFEGLVIQIGGPAIDEIVAVAGPLAEGFVSYDMFDFRAAAATPFIEAYHKKWPGIINAQCPAFYNGAKVLFEAMRRAGTLDTTAVRDVLENKIAGYDAGLYGGVKWAGMHNYGVKHQMVLPFLISKVKNGVPVPLASLTPKQW